MMVISKAKKARLHSLAFFPPIGHQPRINFMETN